MKGLLVAGALLAVLFAGCTGDSDEKRFAVSHTETTEFSKATVESLPEGSLHVGDISVLVEGRHYTFGRVASSLEGTFSVTGKPDASQTVEVGDVLNIPATGRISVRIMRGEEVLASYDAVVPSGIGPPAPPPLPPVPATPPTVPATPPVTLPITPVSIPISLP